MRVKIESVWDKRWLQPHLILGDIEFTRDENCTDYDWLVVYDELPRRKKYIDVHCPPEHTILVTQEPAIIKTQAPCYLNQFNYVLTTHNPDVCRHRNYRRGAGCLVWINGHSFEELAAMPDFPKTELISAICSRKLMKKTEHFKRHTMYEYLLENLPGFSWKGQGIDPIDYKYQALDTFKYHIVVENCNQPYHWSEKIADAIMSLCLPFYSGDPKLEQVLPPESFIRIPNDNPPEALRIIKNAIDNNEYEKRLPALKEARRLLVERYNLYQQVIGVIQEHQNKHEKTEAPHTPTRIYERHYMRRNIFNLIGEAINNLRIKLFCKF